MLIIFYLILSLTAYDNDLLIDFGSNKSGTDWMIINDGVMGGLSKGKVEFTQNSLLFTGTVSLENNGGFTSFRAPYQRIDLSKYKKVEVRYKSTGADCAISLDLDRRFWKPNYKIPIPLTKDNWMTINFNLFELSEFQMGRETGNQLSEEAARKVIRLGIITDSKKEVAFNLEVDYIRFY